MTSIFKKNAKFNLFKKSNHIMIMELVNDNNDISENELKKEEELKKKEKIEEMEDRIFMNEFIKFNLIFISVILFCSILAFVSINEIINAILNGEIVYIKDFEIVKDSILCFIITFLVYVYVLIYARFIYLAYQDEKKERKKKNTK